MSCVIMGVLILTSKTTSTVVDLVADEISQENASKSLEAGAGRPASSGSLRLMNFVSKLMNCSLKMMHFPLNDDEFLSKIEEFCI